MSEDIFKQIYEISLLNLYIYTDCGLLFLMCPNESVAFSIFGTGIDENIHLVKYGDLLSRDRISSHQKLAGYPLWIKQLQKNVRKLGHEYIHSLHIPVSILLTMKNETLFVTFRGTCNSDELETDFEILYKSHLKAKEPIIKKLNDIINEIYDDLVTFITETKITKGCNKIIFSGHSLGAILCTLFVMRCEKEDSTSLYDLLKSEKSYFMILLGMPSIGDKTFVEDVDTKINNNYINICNNGDFMMKSSSKFIPNLNNVIKYETDHFCNIPYICKKTVSIKLGDNSLINFNTSGLIDFLIRGPSFIPAMISHSILKYVENIFLFLHNDSKNTKIQLTNLSLNTKFQNIFQNMHNIFNLQKSYIPIVFNGGNKSKNKKNIKKYKKSKRHN